MDETDIAFTFVSCALMVISFFLLLCHFVAKNIVAKDIVHNFKA